MGEAQGASPRAAVIACGALAFDVREIARRRAWDIDVIPIHAMLHNRPQLIPGAVAEAAEGRDVVAVAYGDCGTHGGLDRYPRLAGENCYDILAREDVAEALAEEPGTYFLTDFLARTFEHTVVRELGLDRYPDLRDAYFANYTRVVWLAQRPTAATRDAAERAAALIGLPLEIRPVGSSGLERRLEELLESRH